MEKLFACCFSKSANQQNLKEDFNDFFIPSQATIQNSLNQTNNFNGTLYISSPTKLRTIKGISHTDTSSNSKFFSQSMQKEKEYGNGYLKALIKPDTNSLSVNNTGLKTVKSIAQDIKGFEASNENPSETNDKVLIKKIDNTNKKSFREKTGDLSCNSIITDIIVQENPQLELEELEGTLLNGQRIKINASGTESSLRNKRDGCTYFGICKSSKHDKRQLIDVPLRLDSDLEEEVLFKIYFDIVKKLYCLTSNTNESSKNIIFIKLSSQFVLRSKHIVSLGDTHVSLEIDQFNCLKIEVVANKEETITRIFSKDFEGPIKLGRCKKNEVVLMNSTLSRVQTSIFFNSSNQTWVIEDGLGNKKSTNGTWIYLDFDWEITQDLIYFRINKNFLVLRKIF